MAVRGWMWFRIVSVSMMILGGIIIFIDLCKKTFFGKPETLVDKA